MMKKYLFLAALAISFTSLRAQKIRYGIEAGINTAYLNIKGEDGIENNSTGWQAGAGVLIPLSQHLALQPKLFVVQRNTRVSYGRFDLKHLELPVCLVYTDQGFTAGVGAGVVYGLSAKARYKYEDEYSVFNMYKPNETDIVLRRAGLTANITMGYIFPGGLSLNAAFSPVLTDLQKEGYAAGVYSKTIGFSIGYYFR